MASPGGVSVGRASVRVLPDTSEFKPELERYLERMENTHQLDISLAVDDSAFTRQVKAAMAAAQKAAGELDVDMDVDAAQLTGDAARAIRAAEDAAPDIRPDVEPNTVGLVSQVRRAVSAARQAAGDIDLPMNVDPSSLGAKVRRAVAAAQAFAGDIDVEINVKGTSVASLTAAATAAGSATRFLSSGALRASVSVGQLSLTAGAATVAVAGLAAPMAAVATAAAGMAAPIAALGAAGSISAITSLGMAVGTLKTAFSGMGDAISAESLEDFNKAIAGMPAPMREGAVALRGLKAQLDGVGDTIKAGFWSQLSNVGDLSAVIQPLRTTMAGLAADMGRAAAGLVDFASAGVGLSAVKTLLHHSSDAASALSFAFSDVVQGLVAVGAAASPVLADLAHALAGVAASWRDSMVQGFQDGSLQTYFQDAATKAQQLWGVLQQLGGIVSGVFRAMSTAGMPFLGMIGQAIEATHAWVNSAQGMSTLVSFFSAMSGAVASVLPVLGQLAGILGTTVAPMIAELVTTLAPALSTMVSSLGAGLQTIQPLVAAIGTAIAGLAPMLSALVEGVAQGLAALTPAIAPLGQALNDIGMAVAPLLPVIGQLAGQIISALSPAVSALAPILSAVVDIFTALAPVAGTIAGVLGTVLTQALNALSPLFGTLTNVVRLLAPIFEQLATTVGGVLTNAISTLSPYLPMVANAFMQVIEAVAPLLPIIFDLAGTLINALMPVLASLMPALVSIVQIAANIVTALAPVIATVLQVVAVFAELLSTILTFVGSALGAITSFVASVVSGFVSMASSVISAVGGLATGVMSGIQGMVSQGVSDFQAMWGGIINAFSQGVAGAVSVIGALPGEILAAMGDLGNLLVVSGQNLIIGFINGIRSMIGHVADAAHSVAATARSYFPFSPAKKGPFSGRGWVLYSGRSIGDAFAQGIADTTPAAAAATSHLMSATSANLKGYRADVGVGAGTGGAGVRGGGVDTSVHIGTLVAADPAAPVRELELMQMKARIRGGID